MGLAHSPERRKGAPADRKSLRLKDRPVLFAEDECTRLDPDAMSVADYITKAQVKLDTALVEWNFGDFFVTTFASGHVIATCPHGSELRGPVRED